MTVIAASTVVRGSQKGERHGAIYLLDLQGQRGAQVLEWTYPGIDWSGAGGARGLRGLGFANDRVFVAADRELLVFSMEFELLATHQSPYLGDAQGIAVFENRVYLVSAGFDSLLAFDLELDRFAWGLHIANDEAGLRAAPFDPVGTLGPSPRNRIALQSIFADSRGLFLAGPGTLGLLHFDGNRIAQLVSLPQGASDALPWRDGVLFNDSSADAVRFLTPEQNKVFPVLEYPEQALDESGLPDPAVARAGFARGLCVVDEQQFASGSSPLTITLHNIETMKTTLRFNLDLDLRHYVHSLAVWPYANQ